MSERSESSYGTVNENLVKAACSQARMDIKKRRKEKNQPPNAASGLLSVNDPEYDQQNLSAEVKRY